MTDILDTSDAALSRTPARFFFETGYFAAYAEASIRAGNRPPFDLTDAIVDHAWDIAGDAHPDRGEFDRYLSSADSADKELADAEAVYRAFDEANREAHGSREGLAQSATALRRYAAELFPANRAGQVHFARILMDSVASVIDAALLDSDGWQPVATAPRDGSWFFTKTDGHYPYDVARYDAESGGFVKYGCGFQHVKYWRRAELPPLATIDREYTSQRIGELIEEDDGFWHACSGCQESTDGYVSASDYPYDRLFRCQPGSGCSECGGIGVLWDDGRGYDDLTGLRDAPDIQRFNVGDWVSHNAGLIEDHTKRQITTVLGYDLNGGVQYQLVNIHGRGRGMAYDCELDAWPDDDAALPMSSPRNAEVG